MRPERVRFSSHSSGFRVHALQCQSLSCLCSDVSFGLVEESTASDARLRLEFVVDPSTWQEIRAPERPPAHVALIQEFLRDYPESGRAEFREMVEKKARIARRLREHRFNPQDIVNSRLVSFDEIVSGPNPENGPEFLCEFDFDGDRFLILDTYCVNPECECAKARLAFLLYVPPTGATNIGTARLYFTAALNINGNIKVDQCSSGDVRRCAKIADQWWRTNTDLLNDVRWRYEKVREIGRRSLRSRHSLTEAFRGSVPIVLGLLGAGRNDPCPCGSGKKYKKCCGG